MDSLRSSPQDAIEKQFHDGVAEPNDPSEFLLKILGRTKDDPYDSYPEDQIPTGESLNTLRAKLPERRIQMQSAFVRIKDIAKEMIEVYRNVCTDEGFDPGKVRMYVVGGRVRQKPLQHSSDIDVVFTVENQDQGLQPVYGLKKGDPSELAKKKSDARKQFVDKLEPVLERHGLIEKNANGDSEGWFVEPKGYGFSDAQTRAEWAEGSKSPDGRRIAVLVDKG